MIYATGDTHGDWLSRLNTRAFPEQKEMTKNDFVIILGDFGYWHDTKSERYNLKWLADKSFTTLFLDGNHENFDRLNALPVTKWHGGRIHRVNDSVFHLMRGQVFTICDKTFFTFGGAASHDVRDGILEPDDPRIRAWQKQYDRIFRVNHISWWRKELPDEKEIAEGNRNLDAAGRKVDFILTHSPYTSAMRQLSDYGGTYKPDVLTDYLQTVKQTTDYRMWLFGHMHMDKMLREDRAACLYEQITRIG